MPAATPPTKVGGMPMIATFEQLRQLVGNVQPKTVAVACAHDAHTLEAILKAREEGLIKCLLVGRKDDIFRIAADLGHTLNQDEVLDTQTDEEAAAVAVSLVREGKADFLQKGLMQTATILKAVVNKETGLHTGSMISHTAFLEIPGYHKLVCITDAGMIPSPDLDGKKAIVRNAVDMLHRLGYDLPLVSALCAAENVSPKILETVDAAALKEACAAGELGKCYVEGPISFDLAMNKESAKIKGYNSPVSGETDIMLVPNITAGNIMAKSLMEFAGAKMAGCVIGAKCPIALNSRSASFEEKYYSLLLCALVS